MTAWAAQYRRDLDFAVVMSPGFAFKAIPSCLRPLAGWIWRVFPNSYIWNDPQKKADNPRRSNYPLSFANIPTVYESHASRAKIKRSVPMKVRADRERGDLTRPTFSVGPVRPVRIDIQHALCESAPRIEDSVGRGRRCVACLCVHEDHPECKARPNLDVGPMPAIRSVRIASTPKAGRTTALHRMSCRRRRRRYRLTCTVRAPAT